MTTALLARKASDLNGVDAKLAAYNIGYLALAWLVAIAAIAGFWAYPTWYTFIAALVIVSSRQQALLNCEHEATHNKFLPNRRANTFVGRYLTAAPVGSPYGAATVRHLAHHRLVGSETDPDKELYSGTDKETRRGLVRYFVEGLLGVYAGMVLMGPKAPAAAAATKHARADLTSLVVMQLAIGTGLTLAFAWWVYPALWLLPLATFTAGCHLIRSFVEHAVTARELPAHDNRLITIDSNVIERQLFAPYNMNLHAEHHLMPTVPAPRLRQARERLAAAEEQPPLLVRGSYTGAIQTYARELKR